MNKNLIFSLLIVNDYLGYLCKGCMSSKLTIFFSTNLFQQRVILLVKVQLKEVEPEYLPKHRTEFPSPVNVSVSYKRFTKSFN